MQDLQDGDAQSKAIATLRQEFQKLLSDNVIIYDNYPTAGKKYFDMF